MTPPNVSILSPVNKTYTIANITTAGILLDFIVDEDVSKVTYSLDGQNDAVIAGNTTVTGLPLGSHNVTMYAQDLAGNTGASETVNFTIASEQEHKSDSEPELFPTVPVATASAAVVALAGVSFLVYHKRRAKQFSSETLTKFSQGICTRSLLLQTLPTMKWWQ